MTLLLDTHVWLWTLSDSRQLKKPARALIQHPNTKVLISAVSVWEVVMKKQLDKLEVDGDLIAATLEQQMEFLDFSESHAIALETLPMHHRDPFDRALIAQAMISRARLLTADKALSSYSDCADIVSI